MLHINNITYYLVMESIFLKSSIIELRTYDAMLYVLIRKGGSAKAAPVCDSLKQPNYVLGSYKASKGKFSLHPCDPRDR